MNKTNELDDMDFEDDEMNIFDLLATPSPSDYSLFSLYNDNVQGATSSTTMENNRFQTTEALAYENSAGPPPLLNNPNPQPRLPNSSAPLPNESLPNHLSSSTVGLISEEAVFQYQNEDLQRLQDLANQFFGETNNVQDSYTTLLQQQQHVEERPWSVNELGIPKIPLTIYQISGSSYLQNDENNSFARTCNTR
ncbi:hypothetical protein RIF29_16279 [Crotalaria pallida]|uniref:Uncharacterized protein n=1 Tax=Crotalaria pallida TaxID=3830 RepID=A0AAN9IFE9_CROPI